ncbi:hypothetical protein [Streptomyces sp. ADI91-18]|uniref:hypothetical protein n=1 Tax=Streptomyces sp. ADI91-18 TaxID=1522755 RepID=UPI000F5508D9|nr:hypothetical protein [Streptomyces sp. ADI91-18]
MSTMASRGRAAHVLKLIFWVAVCLAGVAWTVFALQRVKLEDADTAGVLSVLPGMVGAALGGWGVRASIIGLRAQRTPEVVAAEIAQLVLKAEGRQYRQLLGSGGEAPHGRIDLAFTASSTNTSGAQTTGSLESIASYYRQLNPGRLVITGTPAATTGGSRSDAGAGKTVLSLALLLDLARERKAGDPVPIRLTAASWPEREIRTWLASHLVNTYGCTRRDALKVTEADLVFPVIDGLDEMDQQANVGYKSRSASLMRAIERYEIGGRHCPVVLTCRQSHYQALVSADAQPRMVSHITILPVDAARARQYLLQGIANTPISVQRWSPVLTALELVAHQAATVRPEHAALAQMMDTPWRLTLTAIVFQERGPNGAYLRDPADMLNLASSGRLYEFMLDRYVGAAIFGRDTHGSDPIEVNTPEAIVQIRQIDRRKTWRYLSAIASYLNSNSSPGVQRIAGGRRLSSTDIAPHELWPAGGTRLPRLLEQALVVALATMAAITGWLQHASPSGISSELYFAIAAPATVAFTFIVTGRAWPSPHHVDLRWFRLRAYRRRLARDVAVTFCIGFIASCILGVVEFRGGKSLTESAKAVLVLTPFLGLTLAVSETLREKIFASHGRAVSSPREIIREDSLILAFYTLAGFGIGCVFSATERAPAGWIPSFALYGFTMSLLIGSGRATLRYYAFLACTRRKLPLRLGRFLDAAYQVGILRMSGTAWQFRHRELQNHLATHPLPPSSP